MSAYTTPLHFTHHNTASVVSSRTLVACNPEVLSRTGQVALALQMHYRGEERRARILAEGILQRASMYIMNQAYTSAPSHPIGLVLTRMLYTHGLTMAADLLKYKAKEVANGR